MQFLKKTRKIITIILEEIENGIARALGPRDLLLGILQLGRHDRLETATLVRVIGIEIVRDLVCDRHCRGQSRVLIYVAARLHLAYATEFRQAQRLRLDVTVCFEFLPLQINRF